MERDGKGLIKYFLHRISYSDFVGEDTGHPTPAVVAIIIHCYLPAFLILYESSWKGFELDRRLLTLPATNVSS